MTTKFLTNLDLVQNQLLNGALQNLAAPPSTPVSGQVYWDTTQAAAGNPALLIWNATAAAWQLLATNSLLLQGQNGAYYLARANQTGTQLANTISNLQATVITYTLDTFAPPVAPVNFNSQRLTNVGTPTVSTDGVNKAYVDATIQGLNPKPSAQVATAAALPANTYANGSAGVGATLTATANGVLTVDTYAVALNDLVLVKNEATQANNGLYNLTTVGTASVPYVLTRNVDMDQATEFGGGFIAVKNVGSANNNTLWLCEAAQSITVGTTAVTFTQLNSSTALSGSTSVLISGNVASVIVAPGGGITVGASGLLLDNTVATRKYVIPPFGDGSTTSFTVTHNLGTLAVTVQIYRNSTPWDTVNCDVSRPSVNTVTLAFGTPSTPTSNQYTGVIQG